MRSSRLLAILILLQLRQRLTARALAEEFEVTERTIYRDIDALSAAGVPVYGDRGPGGGFQLLDGYRTKLTGLSTDEAEAMPLIGLPGAASALGIGPAPQRAQGKLLAALSAPSLEGAGRLASCFHLDPVDWYQANEPVRHLPALARAVLDRRRAAIRYESWRGPSDRQIDPLGLVMKAGSWYCLARTDSKLLTFKVANIRDCTVQDAIFDRPGDFDLAKHWRESLTRFERDLRPRTARIRTTPEGRRRLAELGAFAAQAVAGVEGIAEIELPVEADDQAARQLIGIGAEIEVLSPPELRTAIADLARRIAAAHD